MQGARRPRPPFGWVPDEMPTPSWRKVKEGRASLDEPPSAEIPALRFLKRGQWTEEPTPPEKPLQRPLDRRSEPFQRPAVVSSAAIKQKHFRERVKAGKCVLKVECEEHAIETLLEDAGLLTSAKDVARTEVEHAVERLLALLIRDHTDSSSD